MKLRHSVAFGIVAFLGVIGCVNDPNYGHGFTHGTKYQKGERVVVTAASQPTPTPSNPLNTPVDPTGRPRP